MQSITRVMLLIVYNRILAMNGPLQLTNTYILANLSIQRIVQKIVKQNTHLF